VTWIVPSERVIVAKAPVASLGPVMVAPEATVRGGQVVAHVSVQALASGVSLVVT
jgi:hypothetical protein